MKVSVLVTFYNQEDYVDEALQSVFDQKCDFDFEVLIGDDGSTDGTMAKLQKWKQKYPDTIKKTGTANLASTLAMIPAFPGKWT